MASILAASRPSEKLGTHSTSCLGIDSLNVAIAFNAETGQARRPVLRAWPLDSVSFGEADGFRVAGVGMADYAQAGVAGEDSLQAAIHFVGSVGDYDHSSVLRITDAYTSAVMDAHPTCSSGGIHHGVQEGPIGDCVAAIAHALRFAKGRGDGAGVQMVAADHDGCFQFSTAHQPVN